jgi:hypothetical protein
MAKTTIEDIKEVRQKEKREKNPKKVYKWWLSLRMQLIDYQKNVQALIFNMDFICCKRSWWLLSWQL